MKLLTYSLCFVVVFCYVSHAQNYYVKNESNPRDGSFAVYMVNNYVTPQLQLSAGIIQTSSGERMHILASHYTGYDRFGAQSIHLTIDNETITLDRIVNRQRNNNHEVVGFKTDRELLRKLGNAQNITMHLRGNWSIEQEIDRDHIRRFGEFYYKHMR